MDPVTITTTVFSIAGRCLTTARALYVLRGKYQAASLTISAIYSETTVIGVSLGKIQSLVLARSNSSTSITSNSGAEVQPEIESALDAALTGCMLVYSVLEEEVRRLNDGDDSVWNKVAIVWNEDGMRELLQQIRGQQIALSLLCQMLDMETVSEIRGLIQANSQVLTKVSQDVRNLRRSNPRVRAPSSIFEIGDADSFVSSTMFAFDDAVVSSTAYRRAVTGAGRLGPVPEQSERSSAEGDSDRNSALRELLREREEESLKLREQMSKLSRSNAALSSQLKDKSSDYINKEAEVKKLQSVIKTKDELIDTETTRMAKQLQKNDRLEKALEKSKTPILKQVRSLIDRKKDTDDQAVWMYSGVNQEAAIENAMKTGLVDEDTTILIVNEESEEGTRDNIRKKLDAIFFNGLLDRDNIRKVSRGFRLEIVESKVGSRLALVVGGKSLSHCLEVDLQQPFDDLASCSSVVILWHEDAMMMSLEDFKTRVKVQRPETTSPVWQGNLDELSIK